MATCKCVVYYRISDGRKGSSCPDLYAQRAVVGDYLQTGEWKVVGEFTGNDTKKSTDVLAACAELRKAVEMCKKKHATLIFAHLGRFARSAPFVNSLMDTGVDFKAADLPEADRFMMQVHAVMAEWERDQRSQRMKVALAAAKARGVVLGATGTENLKANIEARRNAANAFEKSVAKVFASFKAEGLTQRAMAEELNRRGIASRRGGEWKESHVRTVLKRLQEKFAHH
jgi:DNA invertase Pin-like site-specific DNA recombinase